MKKVNYKEFIGTSWSINNKTTIYLLTIILSIFGMMSYNTISKEQFPEIVIPTIMVSTIYPGTSPSDIENLVTRPLEKNIKSINGVKKITSNSVQDFSMISVEFNTGIDVADAKQKVKDAVDKTKKDLPNNLLTDPNVSEIDFSEIPIMYVNIAGNVGLDKLKKHADDLQDKIEGLKEITRVDIIGALDKEVQINVDMYKMQAANLSFRDIESAVAYDNITVSGGSIDMQGMKRNIRVVGEFENLDVLRNIKLRAITGANLYLKDIADISYGYKDRESNARFNGKDVITLNIIKKSGQNLLDASDNVKKIIADYKENKLPANIVIDFTGDMSRFTRNTLTELNNTIIIGFILVVIVLMFFMGVTNAFFVGLSVPLSMALAYIVLPKIGFTMNMLVMFSFIFALGIVVDDAIVVIENTHRIFREGKENNLSIIDAAKMAAGEVFLPILTGTLTTIAPFMPLAFWPGIVGKFMMYLPITIMITLFASLLVAYIINPVFAVDFMKHSDGMRSSNKKIIRNSIIMLAIALLSHLVKFPGIGNFVILMTLLYIGYQIYGHKTLHKFEHQIMPGLQKKYANLLAKVLIGRRPVYLLIGASALLIFSFVLTGVVKPRVVFFPDNDPNSVMVYIKMPVGTELRVTDSIAKIAEERIYKVIGKNNPNVESVITNIAMGASENMFDRITISTHLGKITVNFVEFAQREPGLHTAQYIDDIREALKEIPGAEITVDKNKMGPPTGKPINIEVSGDNIDELIATSDQLKKYLDSLEIPGIEELKSDFTVSKPELLIDVDRIRANQEGISMGQIGGDMRTAIYGKEISKYREGEDQYPIQLRYNETTRKNIELLLSHKITYMDMTYGRLRSIPLSTVSNVKYENSYGGINRKNLKRTIVLSSNLAGDATANEVNARIKASLPMFSHSENVDIKLTGELEDQAESSQFMMSAMLLSIFLIIIVLVTQFNSFSKPLIILSEIIFSISGVLLGFIMFDMTISIIMTGMGIIALGGIVIRNGILLVEFTDVLLDRGYKTRDAIVKAAQSRITPILLTASATILGLIPLAVGFNIDFVGLFTELNPHIHLGGDNTMFFGPLAWAIVFGLSFATLLTLFLVPAMYQIAYVLKVKVKKNKLRRQINQM